MIQRGTLVSRAAALGLLVLVVVGVATIVVSPLVERWTQLREERTHAIEMAGRFRAIAETRDAQAAELEAAKAAIAGSGLYLTAESHALAGAQMREIITAAVADHGGEVRSVRVLEGSDIEGGGAGVVLRVAMRGRWSELFPTLQALEAGTPHLFITAFTIDSARGRRSRRGVEEDAEPLLQLEFELQGYLPQEIAG